MRDNTRMTKLTQSYMTGEGTGQLLYETIGACFDRVTSQQSENTALVVRHQDIRWTYAEFRRQVDRLATGLLALDIQPGDRVGVWGPNSYEWVVTQFATAKIGAILVNVNPAYRLYELEYVLNKVECKAIVAAEKFKSSEYLQMLNTLAPEIASCEPGYLRSEKLPHLTTVIRMGEERSPGMFNFEEICSLGSPSHYARLEELAGTLGPDDAINIQFTSGTTGNPKGVLYSHRSTILHAYASIMPDAMGMSARDTILPIVPMFHVNAWGSPYLCPMVGAKLVMPGPKMGDGAALVRAVGATGPRFAPGTSGPTRIPAMVGQATPITRPTARKNSWNGTILSSSTLPR